MSKSAHRRHHDRAGAHRAGIVQQQRDHAVAEILTFSPLEGPKVTWFGIQPDARQARDVVEQAFLEVRIPSAGFCCAINRRGSLLARRETTPYTELASCWSRKPRSRASSSEPQRSAAAISSSCWVVKTL